MTESTTDYWKPRQKRFIVTKCEKCSDDRQFKDNTVVYNKNLGFAYSCEEIVEVLNNNGYTDDYLSELLQFKIWYCQAKYRETKDITYAIEEQCLRKLRKEVYHKNSIFQYVDYLKEKSKESDDAQS